MFARRSICRLLIASVALLPASPVRAGMISVEAAMTSAPQDSRQVLLGFLSRPDVASQLQALGVEQRVARERVAAMTDAEALAIATQLPRLPAGGDYGGGGGGGGFGVVLVVILLVVLIIWLVNRKTE